MCSSLSLRRKELREAWVKTLNLKGKAGGTGMKGKGKGSRGPRGSRGARGLGGGGGVLFNHVTVCISV